MDSSSLTDAFVEIKMDNDTLLQIQNNGGLTTYDMDGNVVENPTFPQQGDISFDSNPKIG